MCIKCCLHALCMKLIGCLHFQNDCFAENCNKCQKVLLQLKLQQGVGTFISVFLLMDYSSPEVVGESLSKAASILKKQLAYLILSLDQRENSYWPILASKNFKKTGLHCWLFKRNVSICTFCDKFKDSLQ